MATSAKRIIWISGCPTSGKSWVGDFLLHHHGWHHLDGDEQQYIQHDSEAVHLYNQADDIKAAGNPAPPELWTPYLTNICKQAMKIRCSNLVITRGFHDMVQAEFVRDWMEKEGTTLVFVELQISDEDFVARMKLRHERFLGD